MANHQDDDLPMDDLRGDDQPVDGRSDAERAFPTADEWLALPPPKVAPEFVDRTLARLRDVGLVAPAPPDADAAPALPPSLLAHLPAPAPSPRFVERALRAVQQDRADRWRRLLLRYDAPVPTPDFVARTLAALRREPTASAHRSRHGVWLALATAAAAALLLVLRPGRPAAALRALLAELPATAAVAHSPAVLSSLLAADDWVDGKANDRAADWRDGGPLRAADGGRLWFELAEARR